jgi:site-specific recombinase XerD
MAVHLLEAGRGIAYVADHLGHKNIQNTRIYAQITNPLREQVFRELEQHPKIVRISWVGADEGMPRPLCPIC